MPAGQLVHTVETEAPVVEEKVPAAQEAHTELADDVLYEPAVQEVQAEAPLPLYVPAVQDEQEVRMFAALLYFPARHDAHEMLPLTYVPAAQVVLHTEAPAAEYPEVQDEHTLLPVPAAIVPAAHRVHAVEAAAPL